MPTGVAEAKALHAWVAAVEPDIRLHIRPPFNLITVESLDGVLQEISRRLEEIAVAGSTCCTNQPARASELLGQLHDYRLLAEQYYDPAAEKARRGRPLHEVAPDIELIGSSAKAFKRELLGYLVELEQCLAGAT